MSILKLLEARHNVLVVEQNVFSVDPRGGVDTSGGKYPMASAKLGKKKSGLGRKLLMGAAGLGGAYAAYKGAKLAARGVKKVYNKIRGREAALLEKGMTRDARNAKKLAGAQALGTSIGQKAGAALGILGSLRGAPRNRSFPNTLVSGLVGHAYGGVAGHLAGTGAHYVKRGAKAVARKVKKLYRRATGK